MQKFVSEAKELLEIIDCYFPKEFDGKNSILWLHKFSNNKKQDEWQGFFFEDFCFLIITKIFAGWKGPKINKSARFDYQKNFVWDFKMHDNKKIWAPLNDKEKTNQIIQENSGMGYIIARAEFTYDSDGSLKKWRNKLESRTTKGHMLKKRGKIKEIFAVYLTQDDFEKGIEDGWIKDFNQGKNSGVSEAKRKAKYQINVDKIPKKLIIEN